MRITFIVAIFFVLSGCNETETKTFDVEDNIPQQEILHSKQQEEFSYLQQLPNQQIKEYEQFVIDRDTDHLVQFSPDQIMLVYIHSAVIYDFETIYALTLNDGQYSNIEEFKADYKKYLHHHDLENAFMYRNFNSIKVDEQTKTENMQAVVIEESLGPNSFSIVTGLKKQNNIWKLDINHLIDKFKVSNERTSDLNTEILSADENEIYDKVKEIKSEQVIGMNKDEVIAFLGSDYEIADHNGDLSDSGLEYWKYSFFKEEGYVPSVPDHIIDHEGIFEGKVGIDVLLGFNGDKVILYSLSYLEKDKNVRHYGNVNGEITETVIKPDGRQEPIK